MLANKLALVTGGASGIGYGIAKLFAKNGAHVALADMSPSLTQAATELGQLSANTKISSHTCDVSKSASVNNLFKELEEKYPEHKFPTIIVNSAGIVSHHFKHMAKYTEEEFDRVIDVNLKGTFLVTQAASKSLLANFSSFNETETDPTKTFASIINLSSIIGARGVRGQSNYAASKGGVDSFTKSVSKELGKYKIRVNSIQPGYIATQMTSSTTEQEIAIAIMMTSLQRLGTTEDIAQLALFLASDNSSFITGSTVECNGGLVM